MNQHKTLRQLCRVTDAKRSPESMHITSCRYHSANDENKEVWAAQVLNHEIDRALLRDEEKGLLAQVNPCPVGEITDEAIIALWQSVPRKYQEKSVFLMNWATYDSLISRLRSSPYKFLTFDQYQGTCLLHKPIIFSNDMPCIRSGAVPILYGDFGQVEVFQQGTEPMREHDCITFPGTVACTQDGYAQVRLLDKQAVKGLKITAKEGAACRKKKSSA